MIFLRIKLCHSRRGKNDFKRSTCANMKILFVGSRENDYLQDLTFSGLHKRLGWSAVVEERVFWRYHLPLERYPKNLGYRGLELPNRRVGRRWDYDYVIVGAAKPDCFERYQRLLNNIPARTKTVLVDGGDRPELGGDLDRLQANGLYQKIVCQRPFDVIFKREYLRDGSHEKNVYPLPMSFDFSKRPIVNGYSDLRWDVAFWAVESDPIRGRALDLLEGCFDCDRNGTRRGQKFRKYARKGSGYLSDLGRCRIHLNFRGVGWDTLRYWEIPALGRLMITPRPDIVIPDDFEPGEEVVHCRADLSDLLEKCEFYLSHEQERERIAARGMEKAARCHSDVARADYILGILSGRRCSD